MQQSSRWTLLLAVLGLAFGLVLPVKAADTNGIVKNVTAEKRELVLTIAGRDYLFQVAPEVQVHLGGQPGKLNDLKAGDAVKASYTDAKTKLVITEITRP